jgi:hypothetical protein
MKGGGFYPPYAQHGEGDRPKGGGGVAMVEG